MRKVKFFLTAIIMWLVAVSPIKAVGDLLLLNQVRGRECCDAGSVEALQKQIELLLLMIIRRFFCGATMQ